MFDVKKYRKEYYQKNKEKLDAKNKKWLSNKENRQARKDHQRERQRFLYRNDSEFRERKNAIARKSYEKRKDILKIIYKKRSKTIEYAARIICRNAVRAGILKRPKTCSRCKKTGKIQGHHENYKKPLDVIWLCQPCHFKEHHID